MAGYGYGISVSGSRTPVVASGGGEIIPSSGLSLLLKADAGISTTPETFISQVIVSGAGTASSNGTYTRATGGFTQFTASNGNYIFWDGEWYLFDESYGSFTYFISNYDFSGAWDLNNGELPAPTSSTSTTQTGNNVVTSWADQSGNGFNANGNVADGVNPTFISNVKNGKPILRFGNGDLATVLRTDETTFGNSGEFTIFTAHKYDATGNDWAELISKGDLASAELTSFAISPRFIGSEDPTQSSFGVMGFADDEYAWNFLYQAPASTNWSILCATQSITNNSQQYRINGSLASSSTSVSSINQINIAIGIGNGGDSATPKSASHGGFKGDLAEVIFYNRALTTPERQQVEAYLNAKYAIY